MEKQLFPGIQTAERKGAGLGKRKSKRDPDEKLESGRAGLRGKRREEVDRLAAKGKHKSPTERCGRKGEKGSAGRPSLADPGP